MRKVVGVLAGAASVAVVALWLLPARPSVAERLAALRASGAWVPIEERCRGYVPPPDDLTLWSRALAEAHARVPLDVIDLPEALDALEQAPLEVWRAKDWALDPVSWTAEAEYLARRAAELAEVADVFRTVGAFARLEACSVYAGLVPPEHFPGLERVDPFAGLRALELSLVRAASAGEREAVRRDLEALLTCAERLRSPVNAIHFLLWSFCVGHTLLALEGALPLLGEHLDAEAWAARLTALRPRELLLDSLELERAAGLGSFEWAVKKVGRRSRWDSLRDFFAPDPEEDLEALCEGFELGRAYLRGEDGAEQALERFQEGIDERLPVSMTLLPMFRDLERLVRSTDARLALALTALRLARRGDARWEDVPRELDPWTGVPLDVQELPGGSLRLSAVRPGAYDEERRASEWLVR
jgi:hypothetical protein